MLALQGERTPSGLPNVQSGNVAGNDSRAERCRTVPVDMQLEQEKRGKKRSEQGR
jgi:hypothetical protein